MFTTIIVLSGKCQRGALCDLRRTMGTFYLRQSQSLKIMQQPRPYPLLLISCYNKNVNCYAIPFSIFGLQQQQQRRTLHFTHSPQNIFKRSRNKNWSKVWDNADEGHRGNTMYYMLGIMFLMTGLSYAFVPLYKMICEQTSFTGITQIATNLERIAKMEKVEDRLIQVQFNADVPSSMQWKFKPLQDEIYVHPGETALAFFTAYNPTDQPIVGISTYNLTPIQAAYYFNKIQCFCFDEQILNPGEEVDLPVFFYIDPDFVNDPLLENMNNIMLSYTFFDSGTMTNIPSPFDPTNRPLSTPEEKRAKEEEKRAKAMEEEAEERRRRANLLKPLFNQEATTTAPPATAPTKTIATAVQ